MEYQFTIGYSIHSGLGFIIVTEFPAQCSGYINKSYKEAYNVGSDMRIILIQICVQSHQNDAHVGSYMLLIHSFYLCPYFCPLSREL